MNIVITGASRGIGFDVALQFSKEKSNTIIAVSDNAEGLNNLVEQNKITGYNNIKVLKFDLKKSNFSPLIKKISAFNHVDILINNAGNLIKKDFAELNEHDWISMYKINTLSAVKLIKGLLPVLGVDKTSHIVNISSMGGVQGSVKFKGLSAYSASKSALNNLTECLAVELFEKNIHVNSLALGAIQTSMFEEAFPKQIAPLSSQEISNFICDFALKSHKYMNGQVVSVTLSNPTKD